MNHPLNRLGVRLLGLLALAGALVAAPRPAAAQVLLESPESYRSPINWALELRFGPYVPNIDSEFSGPADSRPHRRFFGKKARLMTQVELDYQFFDAFGTAAVGASVGYFRESEKAFVEDAGGATTARSGDQTRLSLFPTALLLVYRFDYAARYLNIPVVPYVKGGLNYTVWRVTTASGKVATTEMPDGKGSGGTRGWQAAAGVSLLMDFVDRGSARSLDGETGVNHTYFFVELAKIDASGLGKDKSLQVGDTTWFAGLMFEF